jgi:hypothetical protein
MGWGLCIGIYLGLAFPLDSLVCVTTLMAVAEGDRVMPTKGQHVVPNGGKWAVRKAGSERASGVYATQKEAIARGKELAKNQGTELYVHGKDGRIRERNTFGKDPFPPKG